MSNVNADRPAATHYSTEGCAVIAHTAAGRFVCFVPSAAIAIAAQAALLPGTVPAGFDHAPHMGKGCCLRGMARN